MDTKDVKSEFEALQNLYKLLKSEDGDGASDTLDGNARFVLKSLLDVASRNALKEHAEALQSNDAANKQPVPQQIIARDSDDDCESFVTASDDSESFGSDKERNLEQLKIENVDTSAPEYIKKSCRFCKKSSIKKLEPINAQDETERSLWKNESEPGLVTDIGGSYDCGDEIPNKPKETDRVSKEASDAIKEIDLCISSLQLGADQQNMSENRSFPHKDADAGSNSGNPCLRTQPGSLLRVEPSQSNVLGDQRTREEISQEICFPYDMWSSFNLAQHTNATLHLTTQQVTRKIEQTWRSSMSDELRGPIEERSIEIVNQNPGIEPGKWETSYDNFATRETPNAQNFVTSNERSVNVTFPQHQHSEMNQMITNENVPDWRALATNMSPSVNRELTVLNKNGMYRSESTASSRSYSSSSNSENSSGSEEYSLPRRTHRFRYPPSEAESKYGSSTSNGEEDEVYSPTSNEGREVTSSTGSNPDEYSSDEQLIPSRNQKPAKGTSRTKKQGGTLKKMKDKLAIVFHLHHHDHRYKEKGHHKVKSVFSRKKAEAHGETAAEKMMKSVHDKKQQHNHFHGIMEAVLKHVRHSKKSKSGDKMHKVKHGNKKLSQKLQWWKVLQHQRRGNLPSKSRLKIGVGKMKPRLRALPTIK